MSCTEIEILMVQAAQDELPPSEEARLHRHLAGCPVCRKTFNELRQVWQMLDAWKVPEPPAHFAESFSARLAEATLKSPQRASFLRKLERPSAWWTWRRFSWNLAGLALAASLVLGAIHLFNRLPAAPGTGPATRLMAQRTPVRGEARPALVTADSPGTDAEGTPRAETSTPTTTVPLNRLAPDGVVVEPLPEYRPEAGQVHFAVHNFSTNVPEINTKHYNTVSTLYEDPF